MECNRVSPGKWQTSQAVALADRIESEVYRQPLPAEQLTALQPFLYKPILFHQIPFTLPCFMILSPSIHDTRDTLVTSS